MKKAIVLFSGGLDSTTLLYYVKNKGYNPVCLIFDYGQRHKKEIIQAKKIAELTNSEYYVIKFKLNWSGSSLIDLKRKVPFHKISEIGKNRSLPSTYVHGRNTIFLSFAVSLAEAKNIKDIFIGANEVDFSGYPDCRKEYFSAWGKLLSSLGLKNKINIIAPFLKMSKKEIICLGMKLKVPYNLTWSCYVGGSKPCGKCDSCILRRKGFRDAGFHDPLS